MCHAKQIPEPTEPQSDAESLNEDTEHHDATEEEAAAASPPREEQQSSDDEDGQLTAKDKALLRLYFERSDLKLSLMQDIIKLLEMPEPLSFRNAQQFFSYLDGLPGPEFAAYDLKLPDVDDSYTLFARDLLEVAVTLVQRFPGQLHDPLQIRPEEAGSADFVDGERFRKLQANLTASAGDKAVLLAIVINAGGVH